MPCGVLAHRSKHMSKNTLLGMSNIETLVFFIVIATR